MDLVEVAVDHLVVILVTEDGIIIMVDIVEMVEEVGMMILLLI